MKDSDLMKKWLAGNLKKGEPKKKPEAEAEGEGEKEEAFPDYVVLMIFGGPAAYESRQKKKVHAPGGVRGRARDACVPPVVGVADHL